MHSEYTRRHTNRYRHRLSATRGCLAAPVAPARWKTGNSCSPGPELAHCDAMSRYDLALPLEQRCSAPKKGCRARRANVASGTGTVIPGERSEFDSDKDHVNAAGGEPANRRMCGGVVLWHLMRSLLASVLLLLAMSANCHKHSTRPARGSATPNARNISQALSPAVVCASLSVCLLPSVSPSLRTVTQTQTNFTPSLCMIDSSHSPTLESESFFRSSRRRYLIHTQAVHPR